MWIQFVFQNLFCTYLSSYDVRWYNVYMMKWGEVNDTDTVMWPWITDNSVDDRVSGADAAHGWDSWMFFVDIFWKHTVMEVVSFQFTSVAVEAVTLVMSGGP